jgi:diadenylate cyclase
MSFLDFGIIDAIDILVVAYLLYKLYMLIRGSVALNIFTVIAIIYCIWLLTKALKMQLLSTILGQFIGVGALALVVVFQPEIRRFFLLIYSEYMASFNFSIERIFGRFIKKTPGVKIYSITKACINLAKTKTGALIVVSKNSQMESYTASGKKILAITSSELLESIFLKKSPLHDGAVIIVRDKIMAARCILPVSENIKLPPSFGLRHRSAMGISEATNAFTIAVSEETGEISYFKGGNFYKNISGVQLRKVLEKEFQTNHLDDEEDKKKPRWPFSQIDFNPFKN